MRVVWWRVHRIFQQQGGKSSRILCVYMCTKVWCDRVLYAYECVYACAYQSQHHQIQTCVVIYTYIICYTAVLLLLLVMIVLTANEWDAFASFAAATMFSPVFVFIVSNCVAVGYWTRVHLNVVHLSRVSFLYSVKWFIIHCVERRTKSHYQS